MPAAFWGGGGKQEEKENGNAPVPLCVHVSLRFLGGRALFCFLPLIRDLLAWSLSKQKKLKNRFFQKTPNALGFLQKGDKGNFVIAVIVSNERKFDCVGSGGFFI